MNGYLPLTLLTLLGAAACVNASDQTAAVNADVTADAEDTNTSSVNASIHVPAGRAHGDVTTVNGAIRVDDDATLAAASTVNGEIRVGARVTARSLHTVNGGITLGAGTRVSETLTTVNGDLTLHDEVQVAGAVTTVNGAITLTKAHVGGGISTVNGDIDLKNRSQVEGGILVRKKSSSWFNWDGKPPRIVIGPGVKVEGELIFERKVQLFVSDSATIGPVSGATTIRFAGETPPP